MFQVIFAFKYFQKIKGAKYIKLTMDENLELTMDDHEETMKVAEMCLRLDENWWRPLQ